MIVRVSDDALRLLFKIKRSRIEISSVSQFFASTPEWHQGILYLQMKKFILTAVKQLQHKEPLPAVQNYCRI